MSVKQFSQYGFTLIELIIFVVIVSVGLAGVLASLNVSVKGSADPVQPKQALAIAEGLLEEILLKGYCDPDTVDLVATAPVPTCGANVTEARTSFDDVQDFDPTGSGTVVSKDAVGNDWPTGHTPKATITAVAAFGPTGITVPALKIVVTVSYGSSQSISLTGYRTNF
jgi:MSHA pilin protein MshD